MALEITGNKEIKTTRCWNGHMILGTDKDICTYCEIQKLKRLIK